MATVRGATTWAPSHLNVKEIVEIKQSTVIEVHGLFNV